jgi:ribosome biogenesis protein ERB1
MRELRRDQAFLMIVPLKVRGHDVKGKLGILAIEFHPKQPWIFSAGADG